MNECKTLTPVGRHEYDADKENLVGCIVDLLSALMELAQEVEKMKSQIIDLQEKASGHDY